VLPVGAWACSGCLFDFAIELIDREAMQKPRATTFDQYRPFAILKSKNQKNDG
jgi:hypothetical protein